MSEDTSQQQTQQQQPPQQSPAPADLLRQTEMLAAQSKEREAKLAEAEAKNAAMARALQALQTSYMAAAKPEYEKYKAHYEASRGRPMTKDETNLYENIYFNPEASAARANVEEGMRVYQAEQSKHLAVAASLEEMQKKMDAAEKERAELKALLAKIETPALERTTTRAAYAAAMSNDAPPMAEEPTRRSVGLAAGAADGDIPLPPVAPGLLPFLKAAGVTANPRGEVMAGAYDDEPARHLKPLRSSVPPIPPNPIEFNPHTGERNFPNSNRYLNPPALSWLCNVSGAPSTPTSVLEQIGNGTTRLLDHKLAFAEHRYTPEFANTV